MGLAFLGVAPPCLPCPCLQVVERRYSAIVGFENEADANNAAALIKKATPARKK
jgi:hypothetical protein